MEEIFKDYYLSDFQMFAVQKFIKTEAGNPSNAKADRVREWIMAKLNNQTIIGPSPWQKSCPEIIPKLTTRAVWYPLKRPN